MSLNLNKLERVVELASGVRRARCPACAEKGQDKKGEHLRLTPDGKYGCCVFPGDREHRRRIFALAGEKSRGPGAVKVKVAAPVSSQPVKTGILGRLGRAFGVQNGECGVRNGVSGEAETASGLGSSDASDGSSQVQGGKGGAEAEVRTLRTGVSKSNGDSLEPQGESRTLRTPFSNSRVYTEEIDTGKSTYKEFGNPVRSVRPAPVGTTSTSSHSLLSNNPKTGTGWNPSLPERGVRGVREAGGALGTPKDGEKQGEKLPYLTADGTLVIPFDAPERYHWWKEGGQSVEQTLAEIRNPKAEERIETEEEQEVFYGDAV